MMFRSSRQNLAVFAVSALALLGSGPIALGGDVVDVRVGVHPGKTRLVVELTERVPYKIFTLANPYRVVIDFPELGWRIRAPGKSRKTGVITNYRFGLFQNNNSRLVVDVASPVAVVKRQYIAPQGRYKYRFLVDLKPVSRMSFMLSNRTFASKDWVDPTVAVAPARRNGKAPGRLAPRANGRFSKRIVMVDPGHGGPDPGTISVRGLPEKSVTLRAARILKAVLEKSGRYEVVMTRNRDIYIPLRKRYELGENMQAELFISLHADSNPNRQMRGYSAYTLSEKASDKEAAALAAHENRADAIAGIDLSRQSDAVASFLIELRQRQTMNESAIFSELLIQELRPEIRLLRNTQRFAGFAVLKSPDIPSVLMELGYLSNRRDERLLRNGGYLRKAARAVLRAADRYFKRKERLSRS